MCRQPSRGGCCSGRSSRPVTVLRDAENHHGRGVHDADEDPGEPDCRISEVSPIIGKAPGTPRRLRSATGLAHTAWVFVRTGPFVDHSQVPVSPSATVPSHSP